MSYKVISKAELAAMPSETHPYVCVVPEPQCIGCQGNADLKAIGELTAATHLRLARNGLTDEALASFAASGRLEHLNLYGNAGVTDAGLETLAEIATLRELKANRTRLLACLKKRRNESWTSRCSSTTPGLDRWATVRSWNSRPSSR